MKIEFKKEDLADLIGEIIGYGIDKKDQKLIDSARRIEAVLNLDDQDYNADELKDFLETSSIQVIIE